MVHRNSKTLTLIHDHPEMMGWPQYDPRVIEVFVGWFP